MKTIRIFLASSEEMDYDRMVFGNLVRRLDDIYEKRGMRLKLFEWEDYDAAFNDRRKQDEYNEKVRESDIFLALFHKKAGQFTIEEFDVASDAFKEKASPKVFTYLKDLQPGESPSPELEEFKHRLFDEMGHYWCHYDNRDSLQLQFVMQLQLVESSLGDSVKVENGEVNIDGMKVASMDRLRFAAGNEDYVKMSEELNSLPPKIEKARLRLEKFPDDEDLADDLQQKQDRYNKLKEDFSEYQKLLFNTAKRVAQLQGKRVTERMRRAMDAFNAGQVREANIILDEAEADARRNLEDYKQSKEVTELKRQAVISSIEEILLKTAIIMADVNSPIGDRVERINQIYSQALDLAQEVDYDQVKISRLLEDYRDFLSIHAGHYYDIGESAYKKGDIEKAIMIASTGIHSLCRAYDNTEEYPVQGMDAFYDLLGRCHYKTRDSSKALEDFNKAMALHHEIYVSDKVMPGLPDCSKRYNFVGVIYLDQQDYDSAIKYFQKALEALDSPYVKPNKGMYLTYGNIYGNLGLAYKGKGERDRAEEYLERAHALFSKLLGPEHEITQDISSQLNTLV